MTYVNGHSIVGIGVFFPVLGFLLLAARFWIRRREKHYIGVDDWVCIPALLLLTACGIVFIIGFATRTVGYASAPTDTAANNPGIVEQAKLELAFNLLVPLALGCTKLAILLFYRRIFTGRAFQICNWTLIWLVITWTIVFFLALLLACGQHVSLLWGPLKGLSRCANTFKILLALSVIDVITDVFMYILPIPLVWRLKMPLRRKIALTAVFLIGLFALTAGVLRLVVFAQILGTGHTQLILNILGENVYDDMSVVSLIMFWPMVQIGVAFAVACLPTLRPAFRGMSPESVLNSVRSKLSLQSLRSSRSRTAVAGNEGTHVGAAEHNQQAVKASTFTPNGEDPEGAYGATVETKRNKYDK